MDNQKVQGVDFYMIAWQVLNDELAIAHSQMEQEEEAAIEKVMNYLARKYMSKVVSRLKCGQKGDTPLEVMSETLMQRMVSFNQPIHYRKSNDQTPKPQFEDGV